MGRDTAGRFKHVVGCTEWTLGRDLLPDHWLFRFVGAPLPST